MRILVDMDGVLCDLAGKWFRLYNQEYHDDLSVAKMAEWGPHRYAKEGKRIYKYLGLPGFFRDLEPIDGAVDGMRQLVSAGFDVVIVTAARRGHTDKLAWVAEHLPFLPQDNVIFAHRKELVRGDVLFDDAPHHLRNFAKYGGEPVAMDYPYNRALACTRVRSWPEFVGWVFARAAGAALRASRRPGRVAKAPPVGYAVRDSKR